MGNVSATAQLTPNDMETISVDANKISLFTTME